ncbi:CD40 ligand [Pseudonaja textilis]|uniref:CD40 ligand n=1 Tax=Pseudonaja textilis TaxID=8673 RepID=UPI000EAA23C6|nr:CD40 ligand [Pseudonaja textilis]
MEEPRQQPYSPSEMPPAKPVSRATIKTFLGVITIFVIAQMVVTILYILHLHLKVDKMSNELILHEDLVFLKRVQSCRKPQGQDISFLDCAKISESFRELMDASSSQKVPDQIVPAMQTGNPKRGASVHLAGKSSQSKVLHWKNTTYAPKDDVFSNRDGKITISKGGRYYIYAQVTFCSKPELHAPLIFKVQVYLDLPLETHQLLMKGVGTYNTAVDLCDLQSIHLSRAVELQSGHTLFVNVTDISRVDFNYGYTYFGLIQLS